MNLLSRRRILVSGTVQGVGFRPFLYRMAQELGLVGWARNTTRGVELEVGGDHERVEEFLEALGTKAPPAAVIDHIHVEPVAVGELPPRFQIEESQAGDGSMGGAVSLPPDLALCADCRREMLDPTDRRYRYPFLNCTNCGPRYTIARALPYDRAQTSMAEFALCPQCAAEYEDPRDRRHHAQPTACPVCGPDLRMGDGQRGEDALEAAVAALRAGQIGAVQGIGGFHLLCMPWASEELRKRKQRGSQPFALMVGSVAEARQFAVIDEQAAQLLASPSAPIVLCPKTEDETGERLAPGNSMLGILLAYTPLHALLVEHVGPLVATSGNRRGEPILIAPEAAREHLRDLADFFLWHNRKILVPCDDSVLRLIERRTLAIRRGRGAAPLPIPFPEVRPGLWALGAELKAAPALALPGRVVLGPHIGDLANLESLAALEGTLEHLARLYGGRATAVLHDAHPGYLSTQWAKRIAREKGVPAYAIQHHRAHAASVAAEYGLGPETPVVAIVFDGTGYGDDGGIWGGEFFGGTAARWERAAHLGEVALPGGDAAARKPAYCALAHLHAAGMDPMETHSYRALPPQERQLVQRQLEREWNCHRTTSVGRLFDAAASLLGVRHVIRYEAQAAIELEGLAGQAVVQEERWRACYQEGELQLSLLWQAMLEAETGEAARGFHVAVAHWAAQVAMGLCERQGARQVILAGGVFQNVLLLQMLREELRRRGLEVLFPRLLPPNDGGLALGQMYLHTFAAEEGG